MKSLLERSLATMMLFRRILFVFAACLFLPLAISAAEAIPMKWTIDGLERTAIVYAPTEKSENGAPLVFGFHGHSGTAEKTGSVMGIQHQWPEAIVVYMQGLPTPSRLDPEGHQSGWQPLPGSIPGGTPTLGNRDLKFFDAVLGSIREKYKVDNRRIYAAGYSNGAMFCYYLWSARGNELAAIAPCAAFLTPELKLGEPKPVLQVAGQADSIIVFPIQMKAIEAVKKHNGCAEQGSPAGPNCTLYPSSKGAPVETLIHPGGHSIPEGYARIAVKFFKDHPKN